MTQYSSTQQRRSPRQARLGLEALEQRALMTAGITLVGTDVWVEGRADKDVVTVDYDDKNTSTTADDRIVVNLFLLGPNQKHLEAEFLPSQVNRICFLALGGDDWFENRTAKKSLVYGGEGNDTLIGGWGVDYLMGEGGNDKLYGGWGGDHLFGGADNDFIDGGGNDDWIWGNDGIDTLQGGSGHDRMWGGADMDFLFGEEGVDIMDGGPGYDYLYQ